MVFHWSLIDSKSPQVPRPLLCILAVLSNAAVSMVSSSPPASKSSSPFKNPLVTVPKAPITNGIIVTFMFHSFFLVPWQGRGTYLSFDFLSVLFCGHLGHQSPQICKFSLFFVDFDDKVWRSSSWDEVIRLYVKGVYASHSPGQMLGCAYTICSYGQISISCTSPIGSPCPPNRV